MIDIIPIALQLIQLGLLVLVVILLRKRKAQVLQVDAPKVVEHAVEKKVDPVAVKERRERLLAESRSGN